MTFTVHVWVVFHTLVALLWLKISCFLLNSSVTTYGSVEKPLLHVVGMQTCRLLWTDLLWLLACKFKALGLFSTATQQQRQTNTERPYQIFAWGES